MSAQPTFFSVLKLNPPPVWYVTNGRLTVGPVLTGLLMRGVDEGQVPEHCRVSADRARWRKLDSVREIAARKRPASNAAEAAEALRELERPQERIRDEEELAHHLTHVAMRATRAESGMLHLRSGRHFFTRAVLGPLPDERLHEALPEADLLLRCARLGRPVLGPPYGPAEDALALRFAESAGGVGGAAMLPIYVGSTLAALLELSRPGHAFRRGDLQRAERITQRALYQRAN
ncbi:MAG TPA: GAF domain-containing protein [Polyangiaceae bacterium]|jgi:hypothetical protein|nr:GAF domain-containing protein [Polyangiaceae bacterium]